jgi:hypothetical protein
VTSHPSTSTAANAGFNRMTSNITVFKDLLNDFFDHEEEDRPDLRMYDLIHIARHQRERVARKSDPVVRERQLAWLDQKRAENALLARVIVADPTSSIEARLLANTVLNRGD